MEKKVLSIRIEKKDVEFLKDLYDPKQNTAAARALERFILLRTQAQASMKKMFTENELTAILNTFNGVIIEDTYTTRRHNKQLLIAEFEDAEKLEDMSARYEFDFDSFIEKIKALDHLQCFVLMDDARRFWNDKCQFGDITPSPELFYEYYAAIKE